MVIKCLDGGNAVEKIHRNMAKETLNLTYIARDQTQLRRRRNRVQFECWAMLSSNVKCDMEALVQQNLRGLAMV